MQACCCKVFWREATPPRQTFALLVATLAAGPLAGAIQPPEGPQPAPLTDAPLAVIRPADFREAAAGSNVVVAMAGEVFDGQAVPVRRPVRATVHIRRTGDYTLWIRAHRPPGGAEGTLQAELARQGGPTASISSAPTSYSRRAD